MSLWNRLVRWLASPALALTIILSALGLVLLTLFPLQFFGIPADQIARLAYRSTPFVVLYVFLACSTVACFRKRLKTLPRLLSSSPRLVNRNVEVLIPRAFDSVEAERVFRKAGFRYISRSGQSVRATIRPWAPLGTFLFHGSLLVVLLGGVVSQLPGTSYAVRVRVPEGERLGTPASGSVETIRGDRRDIRLPSFVMSDLQGTIGAEGPDKLSVEVETDSGTTRRFTAGWPWFPDLTTMVAAEDFGASAIVSLESTDSATTLATKRIDLDHYGPQRTRYIEMHAGGKRYRVGAVTPDEDRSEALPGGVVVSLSEKDAGADEGWKQIARPALLAEGAARSTEEVVIRLDELKPHAVLRVSRTPAMPLVLLGLIMAAVGVLLRLVFFRVEATVEARGADTIALRVAADVNRTSGRLRDELIRAWGVEPHDDL